MGGDPRLERAIRAHGNFAEYVPLALVLMLAAELSGTKGWLLHLAGLVLLLGRLSHAVALSGPGSQPPRAGGMALTFAALVTLSVTCLARGLA